MSSGYGCDRRSPCRDPQQQASRRSQVISDRASSGAEQRESEPPPKKRRSRDGVAVREPVDRPRSSAQVQSQVRHAAPYSESSARTSTHRALSFLDLPVEIRHEIYKLLLIQRDKLVWFHHQYTSLGLHAQILRTCRQIEREGSSVLYGLQIFYFRSVRQGITFTKAFAPNNASRIRKIHIEFMTNEWFGRLYDVIWPPHNPGELDPESVFGLFPYLNENTSLNLHFKTHHPQRPTNVISEEDKAKSFRTHTTRVLDRCEHVLLMILLERFRRQFVWERWMWKEFRDRDKWQEWKEWNVLSKGLTMSNIVATVLEEQGTDFLSCTLQVKSLSYCAKTAGH